MYATNYDSLNACAAGTFQIAKPAEDRRKEFEAKLRDAKKRGREDVVKALLNAELKSSGLPLSADEIIQVMRDPSRGEMILGVTKLLEQAEEKRQAALREESDLKSTTEGEGKKEAATDRTVSSYLVLLCDVRSVCLSLLRSFSFFPFSFVN